MLDARVRLGNEKKIFKTITGVELDITFKPFGITKLSVEYAGAQFDAFNAVKTYEATPQEKLVEKDIEMLENDMKKFVDLGKVIILTALRLNGQDKDEKWLEENLTAEEFPLLVNYIIGREDDQKKTSSSDGS